MPKLPNGADVEACAAPPNNGFWGFGLFWAKADVPVCPNGFAPNAELLNRMKSFRAVANASN